jgi:hypothetical protein
MEEYFAQIKKAVAENQELFTSFHKNNVDAAVNFHAAICEVWKKQYELGTQIYDATLKEPLENATAEFISLFNKK